MGTQSICPLWGAGSGMLRVQRPEFLSPHGFVLLTSVGMLIMQESHISEAPPLCFISLSSKYNKGTTTTQVVVVPYPGSSSILML